MHLMDVTSGSCLQTGVADATGGLTVQPQCNVPSDSKACDAGLYPELVFELTHGGSIRHVASGLQPGLCLQASLGGLIALTQGCNRPFLQWAFYPISGASAALIHSNTSLCLHPVGSSEGVGAGTEVWLSSSCAEPLADFALGSDNYLRHQYSGLCVGVNPAAPSTVPSPPPPANGAAVESAGIALAGEPDLVISSVNVAGSPDAPVLVSAGKATAQSSTFSSLTSDLAVDGSSSSQADTCATSMPQGAQSWEVDLGDTFQIVNVTVINRDSKGTGSPPFSVFVGNSDPASPGSYTVLDNTNCTAYAAQFSTTSEVLAVPCSRQGRYVVIKSNIGPLVLCEVLVYGYTPSSGGAATESAGNDVTALILTNSCSSELVYTGAGQLQLVSSGQCVTASDVLIDAAGDDYRVPQFETCQSSTTSDMFVWSLFATSSS
ncbi:hypothetical protein ABBQ32_010182 [Trebouxia sp. C0010 RCD-2024]